MVLVDHKAWLLLNKVAAALARTLKKLLAILLSLTVPLFFLLLCFVLALESEQKIFCDHVSLTQEGQTCFIDAALDQLIATRRLCAALRTERREPARTNSQILFISRRR